MLLHNAFCHSKKNSITELRKKINIHFNNPNKFSISVKRTEKNI